MAPSEQDRPDESDDEFDQLEALNEAFQEHVDEFAVRHELPFDIVCLLALRTSITARMVDYVTHVDKPSGSGLKLELDRFRREVDEAVRAAKKGADEFVASVKQALAEDKGDEPPG